MEAKYLRTSHFSTYGKRAVATLAQSSALCVPIPTRQAYESFENRRSKIGSKTWVKA